jgi:hypothetical protein
VRYKYNEGAIKVQLVESSLSAEILLKRAAMSPAPTLVPILRVIGRSTNKMNVGTNNDTIKMQSNGPLQVPRFYPLIPHQWNLYFPIEKILENTFVLVNRLIILFSSSLW